MPNFPISLDALANPSSTTLRNDPGFSLAAAVSTLNDIAEALEQKLGIGASAPSSTAAVLRRTAAGASAWGTIATGDIGANQIGKLQLDYQLATDVSALAISAGGFTYLTPAQSFAVEQANSVVEVAMFGSILGVVATGNQVGFAAVVVDISGTPQAMQQRYLGGDFHVGAGGAIRPLCGGSVVAFTNLVVGTHTVRLALATSTGTATVYCRPTTPNGEFFAMQVVEIKR